MLPPGIMCFLITSLALTFVGLGTLFLRRFQLHRTNYPDGYFLLPGVPFADTILYIARFKYFHTAQFFESNRGGLYLYPPAVAPFYEILYQAHRSLVAFLASATVLIAAFAVWFGIALRRVHVSLVRTVLFIVVSLGCSYVLIFEISRANVEIALSAICMTGMYMAYKDRPVIAAFCFGVAGAMKLYPLIFLGLLLHRRRYREFLLGIVVSGVVTLASLWAICPALRLSIDGVRRGLRTFTVSYALTFEPITAGADHSLFGLIKQIMLATSKASLQNIFGSVSHARAEKLLGAYMLVMALGLLCSYIMRIRHLPFVNQAICFSCAAVVVPPTSFEYTLLQLYAPWVLLVLVSADFSYRGFTSSRGVSAMFACFAALFSNLAEVQLHGARIEGPIKAILVCALFGLAMRYPITNISAGLEAPSTVNAPICHA